MTAAPILILTGEAAAEYVRQHPAWPTTRFCLTPVNSILGPLRICSRRAVSAKPVAIAKPAKGQRASRIKSGAESVAEFFGDRPASRSHAAPSAGQRRRHSSSRADESRPELRATAAELWGRTEAHAWTAAIEVDAWVPDANTWALPHFAEQLEWLRDKASKAAEGRAQMRNFPRNPKWRARREAETGQTCGSNPDIEDLRRVRRGLAQQEMHARTLCALIDEQPIDLGEPMIDEDEIDPSNVPATEIREEAMRGSNVVVMVRPVIQWTGAGTANEQEAAKYLGLSARQMRRLRKRFEGPAHHLLCGRAWYTKPDLDSYLSIRRFDPMTA